MFIDSASNSITRAPAERNSSIIGTWLPSYVSLRWSGEKFLRGRAFYKHLAPNGAKSNNVLLHLPGGSQLRSFALARSFHGQDGAYSEVAAARLFRCSLRVRVEKKLAHLAHRIA
jgi:hypothetical protein